MITIVKRGSLGNQPKAEAGDLKIIELQISQLLDNWQSKKIF